MMVMISLGILFFAFVLMWMLGVFEDEPVRYIPDHHEETDE